MLVAAIGTIGVWLAVKHGLKAQQRALPPSGVPYPFTPRPGGRQIHLPDSIAGVSRDTDPQTRSHDQDQEYLLEKQFPHTHVTVASYGGFQDGYVITVLDADSGRAFETSPRSLLGAFSSFEQRIKFKALVSRKSPGFASACAPAEGLHVLAMCAWVAGGTAGLVTSINNDNLAGLLDIVDQVARASSATAPAI